MQVYVSSENTEDSPVKLLKGFKRVSIKANETQSANISIDLDDIKFYNSENGEWKLDSSYIVLLGTNSKNAKPIGKVGF